mgnify:CR=1 FL=1|jgi:hypothetical protein
MMSCAAWAEQPVGLTNHRKRGVFAPNGLFLVELLFDEWGGDAIREQGFNDLITAT